MADPVTPDNPEEGVDDGRPEWLPSNFESPEAMAQSYKESQRKITELAQQNRSYEENYAALSAQVEELQAQPRADQNDLKSRLYEQFENDPVDTMVNLATQIADARLANYAKQSQQQFQPAIDNQRALAADYAYKTLQQMYPDANEYGPAIGEFLEANSHYVPQEHWGNPQQLVADLDNVYKIVSRDNAVTSATQLAEQAANAERMKLQAQSMSGASGRLPATPQDEADWEKVRAAAKGGW